MTTCKTPSDDPRRGAEINSLLVPRATQRGWNFIAEQPAPAPHLARLEGRAATENPTGKRVLLTDAKPGSNACQTYMNIYTYEYTYVYMYTYIYI